MTYSALQQAVADWLNRSDLTAVIPTFIRLVEAEVNRTIRCVDMETWNVTTATAGSQYVQLPVDWRGARAIYAVGADGHLYQPAVLSAEQFAERQGRATGAAGVLRGVAAVGNRLYLVPVPASDTELRMIYYAAVPALTDSNPTNWLLAKHPDVYLFGALTHSAPYLRDDERLGMWTARYEAAVKQIGMEDERIIAPTAKLSASYPIRW